MCTLSLGLAMSLPAWAEGDEIIDKVEAKYADVSVLRADFVQTTRSPMFGEEQSSGDVVVKRPSKMKWTFSGNEKQFVTDGQTMWVWSKPDNQVIKYSDVSQQASAADSILGSLDKLDELYTVKVLDQADGRHALDLRPKEEAQFKRVHIELSPELVLEKVVITDAFDNVTELAFTDVRLNAEVPDSAFQFEVPAGAEVIDAAGF